MQIKGVVMNVITPHKCHTGARSPMTRSLAEASTRELVRATPYRVKRDEVVLRLP